MKGLRYISLHEDSGYGIAARRLASALKSGGVPMSWTPMVPGNKWRLGYEPHHGRHIAGAEELAPVCNQPIECDTVILHTVPEYFPIWREILISQPGPTPLILGYTVWETDRLPRSWPGLLRHVDGVLVPCTWNLEVFASAGLDRPIELVPHPADDAVGAQPREARSQPFRFYTIGVWTARKAIDKLLHAFQQAFTGEDPVELVIKTDSRDFTRPRGWLQRRLIGSHQPVSRAVARINSQYPNPARVTLLTERLSTSEIRDLHYAGDCYVSLCRSEGWGLGAFDAAAYGKPVVMTNFGGQRDYLCGEAPYLIRYDEIPVEDEHGGTSYTSDQVWADPDVDHAKETMREIFENQQAARNRGAKLAADVGKRFAPQRVAKDLLHSIERIRRQRACR